MERPTARARGDGARPRRAWLIGGAAVALLALGAVWLGGGGEDATAVDAPAQAQLADEALATTPTETMPAVAPTTATIVDEDDAAATDNPFETTTAAPAPPASVASAEATQADNPFATLGPAAPTPAAARTGATPAAATTAARPTIASRTVASAPGARVQAPTAPVAAARKPARANARAGEQDLLDTLMDNIQQSSTTELPVRDTKGMDRLIRNVNRADAEPVGKASGAAAAATVAAAAPRASSAASAPAAAKPAAVSPAPAATASAKGSTSSRLSERQLRSLLEQCPDARSAQSLQCRRSICKQYAPDDTRCARR